MGVLRRFIALTGVFGSLSIMLAATPAGLAETALASGGDPCAGSTFPTHGSASVFPSSSVTLAAAVSFTSVTGTTETDISVDAFNTESAAGGSTAVAYVDISVWDTETGLPSVDAAGCVPNPDFQIDQTLTSARLAPVSVTVEDILSNTLSTATVWADWSGVGDMTHQTQVSHFHSGDFTMVFHFVGFDRFADTTATVDDPALNVSLDGAAGPGELDKVEEGMVMFCVGGPC